MNWLIATVIGVLGGTGLFLLLRRSWVKLVLGFGLLSHAVNLLIFSLGGLKPGQAPIFSLDKEPSSTAAFPDPLPQALILTAIVIGFGMQAFFIVLVRRSFEENRTTDVDALKEVD